MLTDGISEAYRQGARVQQIDNPHEVVGMVPDVTLYRIFSILTGNRALSRILQGRSLAHLALLCAFPLPAAAPAARVCWAAHRNPAYGCGRHN